MKRAGCNHPSGDPTPSAEDLAFTLRVTEAAEVVGTPLVDHVIVAGDAHRSLVEMAIMPIPSSVRRDDSS